ncbi:hypothetical protein OFO07_07345 [Campylobacter sp. JMF_06 NA1]|uniref:hypothetical protein n=1 Tax=Campylobacter sp. JMF_06 NA1 TaxID=2983823 RepID=UPI0022E9DDD5|nr:hypothetical protein [Campylobacter sp. JMF_06 NA1]MDA3078729.1 hypothetical protein [Campylobacter sp. JMF_06 NA1]
MITEIYVKILNEDLLVWRPVKAKLIKENIFKIIDKRDFVNDFDEKLEFIFDDTVECYCKNGEYYANKRFLLSE